MSAKIKAKDETLSVPRKIRGTLEALGGDSYKFTPQGTGESTQQNVVTVGKSKMYETVGKQPQRVAHLVVPKDVVDVRDELFRQVDELTRGDKTEAELPPRQTDDVVCLLKGRHVRLYLDTKARVVRMYHEIPLVMGTNYASELMKGMTSCNQSLAVNRDKIAPLELKGGQA